MDELLKPIFFFCQLGNNLVHLTTIGRLQLASGCVSKHLTGQVTHNEWLARFEHLFELNDVLDLVAIGHNRRSVNGITVTAVLITPAAYHIKILKGKPHRINFLVATGTGLILTG